ncbi:MAG: small subunit ribosomal protein, partial [Thermoleophilaceae bacterium]|nr:small subunit ribosomal protein [Thermoleophilaceae bacterium]
SRRAVLEDERKEMRTAILDRLSPGDVVEGQISNIVDFGAFVDLDGIDGLIHISELSWSHVDHPSEVVSIGQTVEVKVLEVDHERQRISLGLKQTQEDPWQRVVNTYRVGDELEGTVTKVVAFGAFVEILDGVEGLVHISELAHHHVENPREVVDPGQEVKVKILEIDAERRRLSLSVKRVEGQVLPLRDAGDAPLDTHVSEGDLANAPDYGLSDDVFAGQEAGGMSEHEAGLAAAAAAFGNAEQRAAITGAAAAEPEAPAAEADAPAAEDAAAPEAEAPVAEAEAPAEVEEAPAAEAEAPAAEEPATGDVGPDEGTAAEPTAEVTAEQAEEAGEAAAEVQPEAEPEPDPEQAEPGA